MGIHLAADLPFQSMLSSMIAINIPFEGFIKFCNNFEWMEGVGIFYLNFYSLKKCTSKMSMYFFMLFKNTIE